jgi:hypothetical protein
MRGRPTPVMSAVKPRRAAKLSLLMVDQQGE